jgi:rhodanese-related sulfurtransferase
MTLTRVSPIEAQRLMNDEGYVYLDVRTPEEFELGHPTSALNVPWQLVAASGERAPNPQFLAVAQRALSGKKGVVIGCQSGRRSLAAAQRLIEAGVVSSELPTSGAAHVVDQRAGFAGVRDAFGKLVEAGWQGAGLPISYEPEVGTSYRELSEAAD